MKAMFCDAHRRPAMGQISIEEKCARGGAGLGHEYMSRITDHSKDGDGWPNGLDEKRRGAATIRKTCHAANDKKLGNSGAGRVPKWNPLKTDRWTTPGTKIPWGARGIVVCAFTLLLQPGPSAMTERMLPRLKIRTTQKIIAHPTGGFLCRRECAYLTTHWNVLEPPLPRRHGVAIEAFVPRTGWT